MDNRTRGLYAAALDHWGGPAQVGMVFEELGELLTALNKVHRHVNGVPMAAVMDELVDVAIMAEQVDLVLERGDLAAFVPWVRGTLRGDLANTVAWLILDLTEPDTDRLRGDLRRVQGLVLEAANQYGDQDQFVRLKARKVDRLAERLGL